MQLKDAVDLGYNDWNDMWVHLEELRKSGGMDASAEAVVVRSCAMLLHPIKRQPLMELWRLNEHWPQDALLLHLRAVLEVYDT